MTTILERPVISVDHPEQMDPAALARLTHFAGELGIRLSLPDSAGLKRVFYPTSGEVNSEYNRDAVDPVSTVPGLWVPAITRNAARRYANQDPDTRRSIPRIVSTLLRRAERLEPGESHWLAPHVLRDPHVPTNVLGLDAQNAAIVASHTDDMHALGVHTGFDSFQNYVADLRITQ